MAPRPEASKLKRGLPGSVDHEDSDLSKKPRRSERLDKPQRDDTPLKSGQLPSPLTHNDSASTEYRAGAVTPPNKSTKPNSQQLFSPPHAHHYQSSQRDETQPYSQLVGPAIDRDYEVDDEEGQEVWGYLIPLDMGLGDPLVLRKRTACPLPTKHSEIKPHGKVDKNEYINQEEDFEAQKIHDTPSGGYLVGRHHECDRILSTPTVSNRHFLVYSESKNGRNIAVLEDLSANGTYVNGNELGRNKRVSLNEGDIIEVADMTSWVFRYPRRRMGAGFHKKYEIAQQLGKGHFASVYLCIDRNSGTRYAVKKFEKRSGPGEKSRVEGLQQEIAVLMGVSHPSLLCLDDTYDEEDGVYLVLELASEGELFNWIVMKQKLTEAETRKVFVQLFQAVKYLHERNIVHRDIKPENILLTDKKLSVKLADFGLAKIIGEESFTTTLCGTPSYVAPEILKSSSHRRYTRAVDVWSLGVVLYICLCGFPPFSDELCTPQNPYSLAQQILGARFDYPSPYWDSVGDPALDLIDRMLTVDPDKRITIEDCLTHPWTTNREMENTQHQSHDSTDSLRGAMEQLDFSKRKPKRERTMLSSLNEVRISKIVEIEPDNHGHKQQPLTIYAKNPNNPVKPEEKQRVMAPASNGNGNGNGNGQIEDSKSKQNQNALKNGASDGQTGKEARPAEDRTAADFMEVGGLGDQPLFSDDGGSRYVSSEAVKQAEEVTQGE